MLPGLSAEKANSPAAVTDRMNKTASATGSTAPDAGRVSYVLPSEKPFFEQQRACATPSTKPIKAT